MNEFFTKMINIVEKIIGLDASFLFGTIGIIIAFLGLSTWRRQLKGNVEYDTARRIMLLVYKLRHGIEIVRNPYMSAYEIYNHDFPEDINEEEKRKIGKRNAYEKRFKTIHEARSEILVDILEAEVLWGKDIKKEIWELLKEIRSLELAMRDFLDIPEMKDYEKDPKYHPKRYCEVQEIIYSKTMSPIDIHPDDEYAITFNSKIEEIENFLKPYLNK